MNQCYLGLGGNVGEVVATMDSALDRLEADEEITVQRVSRVYETSPVGVDVGGRFLNAAAEVQTPIAPAELLGRLKAAERDAGRTGGRRWSERVIDLDLLLVDAMIVDSPELSIPHPHLWYRRFVLDPLVEIAGHVIHPCLHVSLQSLRAWLLVRPLPVVLLGGSRCDQQLAAAALRLYEPFVEVRPVAVHKHDSKPLPDAKLQLGFPDPHDPAEDCLRLVSLSSVPGSISNAVAGVLTAALDEPRAHSRPLRRMP